MGAEIDFLSSPESRRSLDRGVEDLKHKRVDPRAEADSSLCVREFWTPEFTRQYESFRRADRVLGGRFGPYNRFAP